MWARSFQVPGCALETPALELNSNSRVARVCTVNIVSRGVTARLLCVRVARARARAGLAQERELIIAPEVQPGLSTA